jgi:hypothetical protein
LSDEGSFSLRKKGKSTLEIFYILLKNFGVGIEPTRTFLVAHHLTSHILFRNEQAVGPLLSNRIEINGLLPVEQALKFND